MGRAPTPSSSRPITTDGNRRTVSLGAVPEGKYRQCCRVSAVGDEETVKRAYRVGGVRVRAVWQPRRTFMPCHRVCGGRACRVRGDFRRMRSVASMLMLAPLQESPRRQKLQVCKWKKILRSVMKIILSQNFFCRPFFALVTPFNGHTSGG